MTKEVEARRTPEAPCRDSALWLDRHAVDRALLGKFLNRLALGLPLQGIAALSLVAVFWASPQRLAAAVLALTIAASFGAMALMRASKLLDHLVARYMRQASIIAGAFCLIVGSAWGTAPALLLPNADAIQRLVFVAIVVAIMTETQRLASRQRFAIAYVAPICVGTMIGFVLGGSAWCVGLAFATPLYCWFLVSQSVRSAVAERALIETSEIVIAKSETIRSLLLDLDEQASDWLWRTDVNGRIVYASAGVMAAAAEGTVGRQLSAFFVSSGDRSSDAARSLLGVMTAKRPFRNRLVEAAGRGESLWWRLSGEPLFDAEGIFLGYRGVGSDVSGARNSESRIAYLANFDALTGFANRTNFQAYAARQCLAAATDSKMRALLCLDLDGFKGVNDSLGHEGGDELLKQVAARLTAAVPSGTFVARIGGDEFALWVSDTTPTRAEAIAKDLIAALREPFDVNGLKAEIGASIGIALTPRHGTEADALFNRADLALYRAKSEGRSRAKVFEPVFETSLIERRKMESDIKLALARGEFVLHYQPLVDTHEGRVVCFEALIRWNSPERGFVSPAAFIPAAENAGLIGAVGRYVLFEACRAAAFWPQDVEVAVNVSPPHVRSSDFLQDVTMALKVSGLHPSRLQIEVTEGVFLDKSDAAMEALQTLRARGVKIALDDFGTGYSSLNYLLDFPVDKIKIDQAFIREIVESKAHQAVVDAMLGLARRLSIRVTAEGIETKDQAMALKLRRCDDLQGYLLSKPRPASDVPAMIAEVPGIFRQAVPMHMDSPLAKVLVARKAEAGQAA